ncbi:hypothetical protein [Streptococcus sp. VTCC 12905]|uniref:hypothetical protein n=1 Tax=Streptococcus sp. VTCC 12905 TaxID=3413768 RepID=UPI003D9C757F
MDVWIVSTKNTVSNNQRYKTVRNVDFKPFPSLGNGFLFEMVTEMVTEKVTAGRYIPKNWANFSAAFLLYFRFMDVLLFKVVVVPSIVYNALMRLN